MKFTIFNLQTGEISRTIAAARDVAVMQLQSGESVIEGDFDSRQFFIDENSIPQQIPPCPNPDFSWSFTEKQWVDARPIDIIKQAKNLEINQAWETAKSFFVFDGKRISTDARGRSDIDAVNGYVSLTGQLPPDFQSVWKTLDNEFVDIPDVTAWQKFYAEMVKHGILMFQKAQQLKLQLAAASDKQQIYVIAW